MCNVQEWFRIVSPFKLLKYLPTFIFFLLQYFFFERVEYGNSKYYRYSVKNLGFLYLPDSCLFPSKQIRYLSSA